MKKLALAGLILFIGLSNQAFAEQQIDKDEVKTKINQLLKKVEDTKNKIGEYTRKLENSPIAKTYKTFCIDRGIKIGSCGEYYCKNIISSDEECQAVRDYDNNYLSLQNEKNNYSTYLKEGISLFKTYCKDGEIDECFKLVKNYANIDYFYDDNGIGKILEENCNNGNGKYCKVIAEIFSNNDDKERFLLQGCDKKDEQACMELALFYKDNKDYDKALEYAKKTCELKAEKSCDLVDYINGFVYYYKNRNLNKAIDSFLKSAKAYPMAYCDIGDLQEKNKKKVEFYQKCCDAGIEKGCNEVAYLKNNSRRLYAIRVVKDSYDTLSSVKVICGDGTTEYKNMEDNYGEVVAELYNGNFLVKKPIQLKNACNTWFDIFTTGNMPKIRKKLFLIIAQGSLEVKDKKLTPENLANELISINEFISTGTGNGTPHLKLTRIMLDIMKQMLVYDKKVSPRVKETISLLLQSKLNQAYSYVDKAVSDAELKKIDDYIKEEYFIE